MILLVLATAMVALGSGVVVAALELPRPIDVATGWVVLACSQLVATVLLVGGLLAQLNSVALTAATAVVTAIEVAVVHRWHRDRARRSWAGFRASSASALRAVPRSPAAMVLLVLLVVQYAWRAAQVLWLPKFGYDGLGYHLISPDTWIQSGRIVHTPQAVYADAYPQNLELITAWVGTFLQSVRLSALAQLPFLAMGALAVAGIGRGLGAGRRAAGVAALAFLAIPAVFLPLGTDYVDVPAAAAVLAALHFGVGFARREARAPVAQLFLVGCALGIAAGIKSANLLTVVLVVVPLALLVARRVHKVSFLAAAGATGLPLIGLGAFWYVRDWITYSNPLYPVSIAGLPGKGSIEQVVLGGNRPPELAANSVAGALRSWFEDLRPHEYVYDQRLGGFGLQWVALLLPIFVIAVVIGLRRRQPAVWLLALFAMVVTFASPAPWWARYTLVLPGVALALFAWFVTTVKRPAVAKGLTAALVVTTAWSMWWATQPTAIPVVDGDSVRVATVGEAIELMRSPDQLVRISPWFAYRALDALAPDATIAIPGSSAQPFTHPFVGDDLQRRLVAVGDPADADALIASMDAAGARYVVVPPNGSIADVVASDPERFRRVPGAEVFGEWLVELGHFDVCAQPSLTLATEIAPTADPAAPAAPAEPAPAQGAATLSGRLVDSCGHPISGVDVEVWQGDPSRPLWEADRRVAVVRTDDDGGYRVTVTVGPGDNRLFARTLPRGKTPAAASPLDVVPLT